MPPLPTPYDETNLKHMIAVSERQLAFALSFAQQDVFETTVERALMWAIAFRAAREKHEATTINAAPKMLYEHGVLTRDDFFAAYRRAGVARSFRKHRPINEIWNYISASLYDLATGERTCQQL